MPTAMPTDRAFPWDHPCAFNPRQKDRFLGAARSALRRVADELGLEPGSYEIRSERGAAAESGEVTLRHERIQLRAAQREGDGLMISPREGDAPPPACGTSAPLRLLDEPAALADLVREAQPELETRRGFGMR